MQHEEREAPEALRDLIKCFWYTRIDLAERQSSFEVMPDSYAEIIFYFGSDCSLASQGSLQPLPSPFLMGLIDQPVLFHTQDRLEIIGIRCYPWTVFDLLGLPSDTEEVRLIEHPMASLQSTLQEWIQADRREDALALVEQYFLREWSRTATDNMLLKAGGVMREASGAMPISEVATEAHTTVRTLERKFKQSSGHTVKDVSNLIRFEQVRNRLWLFPDSNIAELASELGYTDQAHLSREFKRYSGTTPAAFARKAREGKRV